MKKRKMLGMAVVLVALFGIASMTGCGKKTVDLNQYVTLQVDGVDTKGSAYVNFDNGQFEEDLLEILSKDVKASDQFERELLIYDKLMEAEECFDFKVSPNENLSNGDTVKVTAKIDEEIAAELKLKFKFKEIKEKVEGLEEVTVISEKELFKDVIVEFSGVAPEAEVLVRNTSKDPYISTIDFTAEPQINVSKGDTITITAEPNSIDEAIELETTTKNYKVDQVDEYITSIEQLSDEDMNKIMAQAKDLIDSELKIDDADSALYNGDHYIESFDSLYDELKNVGNVKLQTSYFSSMKDGFERGYMESINRLDIVYSFDVSDDEKKYADSYISIQCDDIVKTKDGEMLFDISTMEFSETCYTTKDSFYQNIILPNKEKWNVAEVDLTKYNK